jgi:hypothetical protein
MEKGEPYSVINCEDRFSIHISILMRPFQIHNAAGHEGSQGGTKDLSARCGLVERYHVVFAKISSRDRTWLIKSRFIDVRVHTLIWPIRYQQGTHLCPYKQTALETMDV